MAALGGINADLRSVWGMIYWLQNNKDRVIAEKIMPVISPEEIRIMLIDERVAPALHPKLARKDDQI